MCLYIHTHQIIHVCLFVQLNELFKLEKHVYENGRLPHMTATSKEAAKTDKILMSVLHGRSYVCSMYAPAKSCLCVCVCVFLQKILLRLTRSSCLYCMVGHMYVYTHV